jgi:deoxycytidylate deaminase
MRLLNGTEAEEALRFFDETVKVAAQSGCLRGHGGSVIVKNGAVIARGFNSPPRNNPGYRTCLNEYDIPAGFRHDRTCCIHAEQRAIAEAVKNQVDMAGARIYFAHIDDNHQIIPATSLKCTICSRAVLDAGITEFALFCPDGIRVYDTVDFNRQSYEYKTPKK